MKTIAAPPLTKIVYRDIEFFNGTLYLTGEAQYVNGDMDIITAKFDTSGNLLDFTLIQDPMTQGDMISR